ncbi:hypothetical protein L195_g027735, partial [Trifolium pratense]
ERPRVGPKRRIGTSRSGHHCSWFLNFGRFSVAFGASPCWTKETNRNLAFRSPSLLVFELLTV